MRQGTPTLMRRALLLATCFVLLLASTAAAPAAYASATPSLPLERADTGDGVRAVQTLLAAVGQSPGPIDGIFGPMTEAAVEAFQNSENLDVTGVVDQATWDALVAALPEVLMERGDSGDEVRALQQLLADAGHDPGPIDGIFGQMTESAVEAFQSANSLPVTGLVDQATWDALNADAPEILMERGDRGDDVRDLQLLLLEGGFDPGPIDGIFGSLTQSAVAGFQGANDLPVTGKVDQATLDALTDSQEILLERGDSGAEVVALQEKLAAVGYNPGPIDGVFGPMTVAAVAALQSIHGLDTHGGVTQDTLDKLDELVALAATAYSYGYNPAGGPDQWLGLITEVFSQIGLDVEKCGIDDRSEDCIGPQIDNAMVIMVCESDGNPWAVNWASGTTGLFQHRPIYWADRVSRAQALFPTLPSDATPYNPEHNIMVAALLVHESRDALLGYNFLNGAWDDGPEPWGHWDGSSRHCADPPLVDP